MHNNTENITSIPTGTFSPEISHDRNFVNDEYHISEKNNFTNRSLVNDPDHISKMKEIDFRRKVSRTRPLNLTGAQIRDALEKTRSMAEASRYLNVHQLTFKKYLVLHFGQDALKKYGNQGGKGIPKTVLGMKRELVDILAGKYNGKKMSKPFLVDKITREGIIPEECSICGHNEKRILDYRCPLLLDFENGDTTDYRKDNLRLLCYNCYFHNVGNLHGVSPKYEPLINPLTGDEIDLLEM